MYFVQFGDKKFVVKMESQIGLSWNSIFYCKPVSTNNKLLTLYTEDINILEGSQSDHHIDWIFQQNLLSLVLQITFDSCYLSRIEPDNRMESLSERVACSRYTFITSWLHQVILIYNIHDLSLFTLNEYQLLSWLTVWNKDSIHHGIYGSILQ